MKKVYLTTLICLASCKITTGTSVASSSHVINGGNISDQASLQCRVNISGNEFKLKKTDLPTDNKTSFKKEFENHASGIKSVSMLITNREGENRRSRMTFMIKTDSTSYARYEANPGSRIGLISYWDIEIPSLDVRAYCSSIPAVLVEETYYQTYSSYGCHYDDFGISNTSFTNRSRSNMIVGENSFSYFSQVLSENGGGYSIQERSSNAHKLALVDGQGSDFIRSTLKFVEESPDFYDLHIVYYSHDGPGVRSFNCRAGF